MSFAEYKSDTTPVHQTSETAPSGADVAERVTEQVAEMADQTKARVDAGLEDLQRAADEISAEVSRTVTTATDDGRRFVRENPGVALAGAVGLGVLVGLALRSRS